MRRALFHDGFARGAGLWFFVLSVFGWGCTDAEFETIPAPETERDDELTVAGDLCTREPESLVFPLRVLFLVDTSVSMGVTDPRDPQSGETGRERAVRETWDRLITESAEGVRVGVVRFSADAQSRTPVDEDGDTVPETFFTANRQRLDQATRALRVTDRTTNYTNVLGEAYFELKTEFEGARQESLPLSKYAVIFLSDGTPDVSTDAERGGDAEQILGSVEELRELADSYGVGEFSFHTAFLATGRAAFDDRASDLLEEMAEVGGGSFRSFPNGEELNFLFADLTVLRRAFTLRTLTAINLTATHDRAQVPDPIEIGGDASSDVGTASDVLGDVGGRRDAAEVGVADVAPSTRLPEPNPMTWVDIDGSSTIQCGEPMVDSDGDGLSDWREREVGSDPLSTDTDRDGLSDELEWDLRGSGLDPTTPNKSECYTPNRCEDEDGDGECDCLRDTDEDGVCDCVDDPLRECVGETERDCVDEDEDGWCDCPNKNDEGECVFADSDGDGLHDCEEVFYGTAQRGNDTDADGLPDRTEIRFDTNPAKFDVQGNLDSDQTSNQIEVLSNTNPRCEDAVFRSEVAYRYDLSSSGLREGRSCYDFEIDNVTLVPTLENDEERYPGNGWNRILIYAGEVAFDDPNSFASYRVACVMASYTPEGNYKNPPSGLAKLSGDDFVEVRDFDPERDCIWP